MVPNVLLVPAVWVLKSVAFVLIFRVRKIQATYMTCLLIAGVPFLIGVIPLPGILMELCMMDSYPPGGGTLLQRRDVAHSEGHMRSSTVVLPILSLVYVSFCSDVRFSDSFELVTT